MLEILAAEEHLYRLSGFLLRLIDKIPVFLALEAGQDMVRDRYALGRASHPDIDPDEIRAEGRYHRLEPVVAGRGASPPDAYLPRREVYLVSDNDIGLAIADERWHGPAGIIHIGQRLDKHKAIILGCPVTAEAALPELQPPPRCYPLYRLEAGIVACACVSRPGVPQTEDNHLTSTLQ